MNLIGKCFKQKTQDRFVKVTSDDGKEIACISSSGVNRKISKKTFLRDFAEIVLNPNDIRQTLIVEHLL